jgi:hypothetical protein
MLDVAAHGEVLNRNFEIARTSDKELPVSGICSLLLTVHILCKKVYSDITV